MAQIAGRQRPTYLRARLCAIGMTVISERYSTRLGSRSRKAIQSSSDEGAGASGSRCSGGSGLPGTRYSSFTQRPRSTILHRSEQKGRKGLSLYSTGLPQVGHFICGRREPSSSVCDSQLATKRFRPLHQNSPVNEINRTFTPHCIQPYRHTLAGRAHDRGDFPVRQGNIN